MKKKIVVGLLSFVILVGSNTASYGEDIFDWLKKQTNTNGNDTQNKRIENSTSQYSEVIQPFGGLTWDDGLKDVIEKISKIKGLEEFDITVGQNIDAISIKSINLADLQKKVSEALLKKNDVYENPKDLRLSPTYYMENPPIWLGKYRDKAYKDVIYYPHDINISASPIMISGVPFKLNIKLSNLPGLALERPQKVFKDKLGYSYPVVPTIVTLESKSKLLPEKREDITKSLETKYKFVMYEDLGVKRGGSVGLKNSEIRVTNKDTFYLIEYKSYLYSPLYTDLYKKHLKELETIKNKGKQDLTDKL